ncbi:MAG: DUF3426 domain-containing protein, partial [Pseudomonadota bacterium]|nr:DUF3426 domain-containing protein [Pseudomonadota bacterium]
PTDSRPTDAVDTAAVAPVEPEAQAGHPPVSQSPSAVAAPGAPTVVADTPPHRADTVVSDMPNIAPPRKRVPMSVWSAAALLLGALLLAQIFIAGGGRSAGQSSSLGEDATLGATLSAYQLRQWGVSAEPTVAGTLRVRASIMNTSAQSQPYPLLRLTLANRFGTRLGEREFAPAEYLGQPPTATLAPGARVDATLNIVDPGKAAEGFELDVCIRDVDQRPHCAGDAAAHAKQ